VSFQPYPVYCDSGESWLGAVPKHWDVVRLKYLVSEVDERAGDTELVLLGLSKSLGILPRSELVQGAAEAVDYSKYKVVRPGQLVMNKMQAWNGVFAISSYEGMISPDYAIFDFLEPGYADVLCATLRTDMAAGELFTRCRGMGTAFLRLNSDDFYDVKIALPPKNERAQITSFVERETSKLDELIQEQRRLIGLLGEKREAAIAQAVARGLNPEASKKDSGIEWLALVPDHWDVKRLRFLCDIETGDADTADSVAGGTYPLFVRSPIVEGIDRYSHDCEAVLTAGDGAGVGRVFHHFEGKFCAHQRVYIFSRFREVSSKFFFHYLKANFFKVALEGGAKSTVDSLRRPMLANFSITIPPSHEQEQIVAYVDTLNERFDSLSDEAIKGIALLEEHRAALIYAAVTGKIDMRNASSGTLASIPDLRLIVGSAVISALAGKRTFGRVKFQRLLYLAEAHAGIDLGGKYLREAAGPLDRDLVADVERRLVQSGSVDICQDGPGGQVEYRAQTAAASASELERLGDDAAGVRRIIELFADVDTRFTEAVTTLYAVWNDALIDRRQPTTKEIVDEVLNDWHPEKKEKFRADELETWLGWMERNGLVPTGKGPKTMLGRLFA